MRINTEAELDAFDRICERLAGFDPVLGYEYVDGLLCALAAGPRPLALADCVDELVGEAFGRAFADPDDRAQALRHLQPRLASLLSQLDPESLIDDPDALRLEPLMVDWDDEARRRLVEEGQIDAETAQSLQTGTEWAEGFLAGVAALPALWKRPEDEEAGPLFEQSLAQIAALELDAGSEALQAHVAAHYPDRVPTRDDLIAEACMAVQDLRLYWVDFAARPPTRRVEPQPGRNDPCPCGSGRKYKKCHGQN
ncbi:MAG: UPF0149 family protein [Burkholderiales bacterium]|nr:UPF0149 family protein [Burkholderiales bacterium]